MDFRLTDEQIAIRDMLRDFAKKEIAPTIMEFDETKSFPEEIIKKLADLGLMGEIARIQGAYYIAEDIIKIFARNPT